MAATLAFTVGSASRSPMTPSAHLDRHPPRRRHDAERADRPFDSPQLAAAYKTGWRQPDGAGSGTCSASRSQNLMTSTSCIADSPTSVIRVRRLPTTRSGIAIRDRRRSRREPHRRHERRRPGRPHRAARPLTNNRRHTCSHRGRRRSIRRGMPGNDDLPHRSGTGLSRCPIDACPRTIKAARAPVRDALQPRAVSDSGTENCRLPERDGAAPDRPRHRRWTVLVHSLALTQPPETLATRAIVVIGGLFGQRPGDYAQGCSTGYSRGLMQCR